MAIRNLILWGLVGCSHGVSRPLHLEINVTKVVCSLLHFIIFFICILRVAFTNLALGEWVVSTCAIYKGYGIYIETTALTLYLRRHVFIVLVVDFLVESSEYVVCIVKVAALSWKSHLLLSLVVLVKQWGRVRIWSLQIVPASFLLINDSIKIDLLNLFDSFDLIAVIHLNSLSSHSLLAHGDLPLPLDNQEFFFIGSLQVVDIFCINVHQLRWLPPTT